MAKIHLLPHDLISKIAAGEVIERPVYALKELVENSIDAQATRLKIELHKAGLSSIVITDNGEGMSREDLEQSYKPHTTSKINSESDLFAVQTMGFRGEALASIASISSMTIRSRTIDYEVGNQLEILNGEPKAIIPFGMPVGTQIIISNLFGNVPARKKFLTNPGLEFRLILEMLSALALAMPKVAITLYHNNKKVFELPENQDSSDRAVQLFGNEFQNNLLPIQNEDNYLTISGFIAKPQLSTGTTSRQFIYVNNRRVIDKQITTAIKNAYGTLLEPRVHPVFILFITVPFERVDVNVHPRKEYVAFSEQEFLVQAIKTAVINRLSVSNLIYNDRRWSKGRYAPLNYDQMSTREGDLSSTTAQILKENVTPWNVEENLLDASTILQMHNLYLVLSTKKGILLIDQHAAHERILYEQFLTEFNNQKNTKISLPLDKPIGLDLSISEQEKFRQNRNSFEELGYQIDIVNYLQLKAVPKIFKGRNQSKIIKEFLEDIENDTGLHKVDSGSHKMIAYLACRKAIKAGDALTNEQAINLVKKLHTCEFPFTCPHGRPVVIEISLNELHHLFHRK